MAQDARCITIEIYTRTKQASDEKATRELRAIASARSGWIVKEFDVEGNQDNAARFSKICSFFKLNESTPIVYTCGRAVVGFSDAETFKKEVLAAITMTVFVRTGCPHCYQAKEYLPSLHRRFPGVEIQLREITSDAQASRDLQELARKHRTAAVSVPVFHVCDQLVVGFDSAATTGKRIESVLERWSRPCWPLQSSPPIKSGSERAKRITVTAVAWLGPESSGPSDPPLTADRNRDATLVPTSGDTDLPLPEPSQPVAVDDSMELPYFGRVSASSLGLPLFTIVVGLVDGFNPCAMWVLVFLLSVLVNLKNRWKIFAVAGTFVFISGAAYLAFMAAWMNIFLFVGLLRWVQIALAFLAIGIGAVHVKDFFAFKKGITFSIPESAKPGIYNRVHRIVVAENLIGAIVGASVLAVLVNMIEMLCTAGLPALYTNILSAQQMPVWKNYAYLLLYIAAYMFDDTVTLTIVLITLSHRKLQETEGRWLKLVSGLAIIALGAVMLIRPQWLGMVPYMKPDLDR